MLCRPHLFLSAMGRYASNGVPLSPATISAGPWPVESGDLQVSRHRGRCRDPRSWHRCAPRQRGASESTVNTIARPTPPSSISRWPALVSSKRNDKIAVVTDLPTANARAGPARLGTPRDICSSWSASSHRAASSSRRLASKRPSSNATPDSSNDAQAQGRYHPNGSSHPRCESASSFEDAKSKPPPCFGLRHQVCRRAVEHNVEVTASALLRAPCSPLPTGERTTSTAPTRSAALTDIPHRSASHGIHVFIVADAPAEWIVRIEQQLRIGGHVRRAHDGRRNRSPWHDLPAIARPENTAKHAPQSPPRLSASLPSAASTRSLALVPVPQGERSYALPGQSTKFTFDCAPSASRRAARRDLSQDSLCTFTA